MILPGQVGGDDRDPGGCFGPVPVADPDEEHAQGAEPVREGARGESGGAAAGPGGQPGAKVLDVPAAQVGDESDLGRLFGACQDVCVSRSESIDG